MRCANGPSGSLGYGVMDKAEATRLRRLQYAANTRWIGPHTWSIRMKATERADHEANDRARLQREAGWIDGRRRAWV